jgi:hypothetical protein
MFTGLASVPGIKQVGPVTSIDHALWFHRPAMFDDWVLMDLLPESTGGGRGRAASSAGTARWPSASPRSRCSGRARAAAGRSPSEGRRPRQVYSRIVQNESGVPHVRPSALVRIIKDTV